MFAKLAILIVFMAMIGLLSTDLNVVDVMLAVFVMDIISHGMLLEVFALLFVEMD